MLKKILSSPLFSFVSAFCGYVVITVLLYQHRLPYLWTRYAMPDVDTDGGLWYHWYLVKIATDRLIYDVADVVAHPFGYDIAYAPINNLIYSFQAWILHQVLGFSWQNLVFITNLSSLIVYPLAGLGAFLLAWHFTRHTRASFIAGLLYAFSPYVVLMGRGQMSINHVEFIPYFLLTVVYFMERRSAFFLVLSSLSFAILFKIDPYYAFFCGMFSVIFVLFYQPLNWKQRLSTFFVYYAALLLMTMALNSHFILGNLYLFDAQKAAQTGRASTPENELLPLWYYYAQQESSWLYSWMKGYSSLLYILPLGITLAGLYLSRQRPVKYVITLCLLLCIVLSGRTEHLFWSNQLYFTFFGMFRGVARLAICAPLFLGLLVSFSLTDLAHFLKKRRHGEWLITTGWLVIGLLCFSLGLTMDGTWYRQTNLEHSAELYEPIKNNPSIKTIAPYPMQLGAKDNGFPQTYQLIGQIIHQKNLASGVNPFEPVTAEYYAKINDPFLPETIDELTKYGVDTLVIYNNLLSNSGYLNELLKQDPRLSWLGHYTAPKDEGYISTIDVAKDIDIYQIKAVVENYQPPALFSWHSDSESSQPLEYQQVATGKYVITVPTHQSGTLAFNLPYSPKWVLYPGDLSGSYFWSFLNKTSPKQSTHHRFSETYNGWKIPAADTATYTLYFQPQAVSTLGSSISYATLVISLTFLLSYYPVQYLKMQRKKS
ncbi:MAG TPA: hypothetical protein VD999_05320 [Vitreimonas sp.]|nr:hypothetical protein [Vitreimonas sp.]